MQADADATEFRAFRRRLLKWYDANARDLPWRRTSDPYRIWVSEIMLQQTTVAAVVPYYERFLAAFPTVADLAAAEEAEVLKLWEGLGYYSRGRNLRKAARVIRDEHGGRFPRSLEEVNALPGVGRYTAGAVVSFAYDRPAPIVEANTKRLFARLMGLDADLTAAEPQRRLWAFAEAILPKTKPGRVNQAVMELGSQVCRPKEPACDGCPVANHCGALATDRVDDIPRPKKRPEVTDLTEACVVVRRGEEVLVRLRPEGEWWAGLYDFVRLPAEAAWLGDVRKRGRSPLLPGVMPELEAAVEESTGLRVAVDEWLRELRHGVTRYRIRLLCVAGRAEGGRLTSGRGYEWAAPARLAELPLTKTARQVAGMLA